MQAGLFTLFIYLFIVWHGVALRVAFMGHWGGTLVAFTVLAGFYWALGLDVCCAFQAFGPVIFVAFRVFVAFMGH